MLAGEWRTFRLQRVIDADRRGLIGTIVDTIAGDSVLETAISAAIEGFELPELQDLRLQ